jgi:heme exporter protein B
MNVEHGKAVRMPPKADSAPPTPPPASRTSAAGEAGGVVVTRPTGAAGAALALMQRDLRVALRRPGDMLQPLGFFVVVTTLFPLALQPEMSLLRDIAPGALWVAALLASLLALDLLFREDAQDGTLEQLALCGQPLTGLLLAKTAVHWLLTGLPLVVVTPLAAAALGAPLAAIPGILAALLLGTVTLSLMGAVGAGLTMGMKRNGSLLALLVLPLAVPVLIFGARATEQAIGGEPFAAALYLLGAMAVLTVTLAPWAVAASVRIGLE